MNSQITNLTANIVSAHVGHNELHQTDLPALIRDVHQALSSVNREPTGTGEDEVSRGGRELGF